MLLCVGFHDGGDLYMLRCHPGQMIDSWPNAVDAIRVAKEVLTRNEIPPICINEAETQRSRILLPDLGGILLIRQCDPRPAPTG
jgi:hypothetical protein